MNSWRLEGFHLKGVLAEVCDMPETRIELPADFDPALRYDCSVVLAPSQPFSAMNHLMQEGLEAHFQIEVTRETRPTDVYVLTVSPGGLTAVQQAVQGSGGLGSVSFDVIDFDVMTGLDGGPLSEDDAQKLAIERFKAMMAGASRGQAPIQRISGSGGVAFLCDMLERSLDRPVIEETGLTGSYLWDVQVDGATTADLIAALREQVGLVATPAQRAITTLVVRRR